MGVGLLSIIPPFLEANFELEPINQHGLHALSTFLPVMYMWILARMHRSSRRAKLGVRGSYANYAIV